VKTWLRRSSGPKKISASGAMSVSPSYLDDLRTRYRRFLKLPADVIKFGASQADLAHARALPPPEPVFPREPGQLHLLYTGASGPVMPHSLTVLFTSLRQYADRWPEKARRLRLHFVGTSYVAPGQGRFSVIPVAESCGVAEFVQEIPHRVGHLEALRRQLEADVLLLPGSSDLAYSPSKVYPYVLTGRPILGLVFRDSVMEQLLDEMDCAYVVRFREHEPKDEAYAALHRFYDLLLAGLPEGSLPPRTQLPLGGHFQADALTRQQCNLFDRAIPAVPPLA